MVMVRFAIVSRLWLFMLHWLQLRRQGLDISVLANVFLSAVVTRFLYALPASMAPQEGDEWKLSASTSSLGRRLTLDKMDHQGFRFHLELGEETYTR